MSRILFTSEMEKSKKIKNPFGYRKFICNVYNPTASNAMEKCVSLNANPDSLPRLFQYFLEYVSRHIIGNPKETNKYSVQQLKDMNIVGLYEFVPSGIPLMSNFDPKIYNKVFEKEEIKTIDHYEAPSFSQD